MLDTEISAINYLIRFAINSNCKSAHYNINPIFIESENVFRTYHLKVADKPSSLENGKSSTSKVTSLFYYEDEPMSNWVELPNNVWERKIDY